MAYAKDRLLLARGSQRSPCRDQCHFQNGMTRLTFGRELDLIPSSTPSCVRL